MKTLAELYQEAVAVQDASNLCGVAQSFARAMIDLGEYCPAGTQERNTHPITSLWVDKLISLNQYDMSKVDRAYDNAQVVGVKL